MVGWAERRCTVGVGFSSRLDRRSASRGHRLLSATGEQGPFFVRCSFCWPKHAHTRLVPGPCLHTVGDFLTARHPANHRTVLRFAADYAWSRAPKACRCCCCCCCCCQHSGLRRCLCRSVVGCRGSEPHHRSDPSLGSTGHRRPRSAIRGRPRPVSLVQCNLPSHGALPNRGHLFLRVLLRFLCAFFFFCLSKPSAPVPFFFLCIVLLHRQLARMHDSTRAATSSCPLADHFHSPVHCRTAPPSAANSAANSDAGWRPDDTKPIGLP